MKIHEKTYKRLTYAPHSVNGCYLGPVVDQYICYTCYNIDTGGGNTPDKIALLPAFMKITNYSIRDMAIHAAADLTKALQIPSPESHFQVGDAQLKSIRELAQIFDAETKILNRGALLTPPDSIMNKRTKLPRVKDQTGPPSRVDPDKESKTPEQKLPSPIQTTPSSQSTRETYTKKLKKLVNQLR